MDRKLYKHMKGTSILVSNSLVKPEKFKFSTKVTNKISKVIGGYLD